MKPNLVTVVLVCLSLLSGCGAGTLGPGVASPPPRSLVSISVTPADADVLLGTFQQFTATGTYSDHTSQDLTDSVTWSSSDSNEASIVAGGMATALALGLGYDLCHFRLCHRKHDHEYPARRPDFHYGSARKQEDCPVDEHAISGNRYLLRRKHSQCDRAGFVELIQHCGRDDQSADWLRL